jgi:antitoxin ParD1/3/4
MRSSMNISLPPALREWVENQVETRGFGTASEFVRDMLRRERERSLRFQIDQSLAKAMESPASPMTESDWVNIEKAGRKLAAKRKNA